jgi:zinc transporter, ZIP family
MSQFLFALVLATLPVISNFIGAMIAEALHVSNQSLGLALHAAVGVLLAIVFTELLPQIMKAEPVLMTIVVMFLGGAFFVWINQLLKLNKNRLRGIDLNTMSEVIFFSIAINLFGDGLMIGTNLTIAPHLSVMLNSACLGATLGYWGLRGQPELPKLIVLAFTTGTLITAITEEIMPEAHQTQDSNWSSIMFISSFAFSMLFSAYLE